MSQSSIINHQSSINYEITETGKNEWLIHFKGRIEIGNTDHLLKEIQHLIRGKSPVSLIADLGDVTYIDDFGAVSLSEIREMTISRKGHFDIINADDTEAILFRIEDNPDEAVRPGRKRKLSDMIARFGESVISEVSNLRFMITFAGSLILSFIHVCFRPGSLRMNDTVTFMEKTGVDALPIVALISFLLGLIMAFMSSIQFRQFGAGIYVASLVAFAMVSELGPIMTAIVVAGRSGSAFAAEIGTMKISEEIDALFTMGFDPVLFLAIPRLIASLITVPLLTLFSNIFAIAGGLMVGVFMLNLTPNTYIKETLSVLTLTEILWGMTKSAVFAALIAWIGCLRGFQARGGASAVGSAATSAVVSSIFLIILFDSLFAVIRSYW